MDTDDRRKIYEQYGTEKNTAARKIAYLTIAVVILLAAYSAVKQYSGGRVPPGENSTIFADVVMPGSHIVRTNLPDTECYWIRSTTTGSGYIVEIREYNSSTKNCIGEFLNTTEFRIEKPFNILGNDCICGKKICEMENIFENNMTNLKIKGC